MRSLLLLGLVACVETSPEPPQPPWQQKADLLDGRRRVEASAAALGTKLVVIGGFATSDTEVPRLEINREILEYDPFTDTWSLLDVAAPEAWTHAQLAAVGGSLYLLGGLEGDLLVPSGRTWRLRPGATEWEPLAPMPEGRGAAAVVATPNHVYLFGGITPAGTTATVLDYVISANRWDELPPLPTPRSHSAAMQMQDGTLIVAGGLGPSFEPLGDVYGLPVGSQTWELRDPMPTPRGNCAYGVVFSKLVCAGGASAMGASRVTEAYDPNTNTWSMLPDMPVERAGAAGAVVAGRLYVAGGSATLTLQPTSTLFQFDLLDTVPR